MNHKIKKGIVILFLLSILIIIIGFIGLSILFPLPCGYTNFAWGAVRQECSCFGIEVDTSCKTPEGYPCPDAGGSTGCYGIITDIRCYDYDMMNENENFKWTQVSCNN